MNAGSVHTLTVGKPAVEKFFMNQLLVLNRLSKDLRHVISHPLLIVCDNCSKNRIHSSSVLIDILKPLICNLQLTNLHSLKKIKGL